MSVPVSAKIVAALVCNIPGTLGNSCHCGSKLRLLNLRRDLLVLLSAAPESAYDPGYSGSSGDGDRSSDAPPGLR